MLVYKISQGDRKSISYIKLWDQTCLTPACRYLSAEVRGRAVTFEDDNNYISLSVGSELY
jgi:hypothetical protein